jgi:hypothetical protein
MSGAEAAFTKVEYGDIFFGGLVSAGIVNPVHGYANW